jgi:hypothetical protein
MLRPISAYKESLAKARELLELVDLWGRGVAYHVFGAWTAAASRDHPALGVEATPLVVGRAECRTNSAESKSRSYHT